MANNYVLFSEALGPLTEEEIVWWGNAIDSIWDGANKDGEDKDPWVIDFDFHIADGSIYFSSMDSGDVDQVCDLVHRFFKEAKGDRREDRFTLRFAYTCSKSRPGEFGGGIVCVTRHDITHFDDSVWEDATFKQHDLEAKDGQTSTAQEGA